MTADKKSTQASLACATAWPVTVSGNRLGSGTSANSPCEVHSSLSWAAVVQCFYGEVLQKIKASNGAPELSRMTYSPNRRCWTTCRRLFAHSLLYCTCPWTWNVTGPRPESVWVRGPKLAAVGEDVSIDVGLQRYSLRIAGLRGSKCLRVAAGLQGFIVPTFHGLFQGSSFKAGASTVASTVAKDVKLSRRRRKMF